MNQLNADKFFEPYKGRNIEIGLRVDVYRNLHTDNGYSIRCSKTGLVLAHCSTVTLQNVKFHVSESGRLKTVQEKRKRVHAYIRGELVAYNEDVPSSFKKVLYNPFFTPLFTDSETNKPVFEADRIICSGKYAFTSKKAKGLLTDDEVAAELIDMGYDLTDQNGDFSPTLLVEMAVNENIRWIEEEDAWDNTGLYPFCF